MQNNGAYTSRTDTFKRMTLTTTSTLYKCAYLEVSGNSFRFVLIEPDSILFSFDFISEDASPGTTELGVGLTSST